MWKRITELFRRGRLDRELDDEVSFHLAELESMFRRQGMGPQAAAAAARREFGGVAHAKEAYRDRRGVPWLETLFRDFRYGARALRGNPGFTAAAVLSLALGIGASTAVFSMFHALMMRMLPVSHPEELVSLYRTGAWGRGISSYPLYLEIRKRDDLFAGVIGSTTASKVVFQAGGSDRVESVMREFVTGNYFEVLGVAPAMGRLFTDNDNRTPHAHPLVVLSYDFWRNRLGGDPGVVGRSLVVDKTPVTVVGVAAPAFHGVGVDRPPDLWEPAMMYKGDLTEPGMNMLWIVSRVRPAISRGKLQAAMDVTLQQFLTAVYGSHPNAAFRRTAMGQHIEVREGGLGLSLLRDRFGNGLTILMAAVLLVLLAACVNVANLLLARGAARQKEIALRVSLGARRGRLVAQALAESLLLAAAGAASGILLAFWGERGLLHFLPAATGDPFHAGPDSAMLGFCVAAALGSVLLFGLAPALRSAAVSPMAAIRGVTRGGPPTFRRVLVVAQVAFSVVLAVLAFLFGHSLSALRSTHLGFRNLDVLAFSLDLPGEWKAEDRLAVRRRMMTQLESLPGISGVSFAFPGPYLSGTASATVRVPGSAATANEAAWVNFAEAGPRYFRMLGVAPVEGREFDRSDDAAVPTVALVNQAFLKKFLPEERHPLQRVLSIDPEKPPIHIVGVIGDILHNGLREKAEPEVYLPAAMNNTWGIFLVQSQMPRDALVQAIHRETARLGPQVNAGEPRTIRQDVDDSIFQERMLATLSGCFGGLTLLLAALGLYGVVAYATTQRAAEIGIRIALGAQRGAVTWMVLRGALLLVGGGLAIGLGASLAAARYVSSVLYGIGPNDPLAFAGTAAVLLGIGVGAAFLPARRSSTMDPMQALRHE